MFVGRVARVQDQMLVIILLRVDYGIGTSIMLLVESRSFALLLVPQGCCVRLLT